MTKPLKACCRRSIKIKIPFIIALIVVSMSACSFGAATSSHLGSTSLTREEEHRLYHYDGWQSNLPLVDNVVDLRFEYFGDPLPAQLRKPVSDPVGPWTTYGPKPPPLGTNYSSDDWGDGENCLFQVVNGQQVPRLPDLSAGAPAGALVEIPYSQLNDGPWCPGTYLCIRKRRNSWAACPGVGNLRAGSLAIMPSRTSVQGFSSRIEPASVSYASTRT